MNKPIYISSFRSVSAYGFEPQAIKIAHANLRPLFSEVQFQNNLLKVARLSEAAEAALQDLKADHPKYSQLDRSVLMAILCTRACVEGHAFNAYSTGINMGSSRGATQLFEAYHRQFIQEKQVPALSSPTTTLGNLATWPAQDIGLKGVQIIHSITCSTALHGFLNARAWLVSGMSDAFIVGGTEAPLTDFTFAQMKAIKLYAKSTGDYPCESLKLDKTRNTLVLGEAAASALLTTQPENAEAEIIGFGYATEQITHNISISTNAQCFQDSMRMALKDAGLDHVDAVVMHAPGTLKGDQAEINAVKAVFVNLPHLTTNKWQIGHSFGASGMMSIQSALYMLKHGFYENPFYNQSLANEVNTVMVNAVGFGGNAVSLILKG